MVPWSSTTLFPPLFTLSTTIYLFSHWPNLTLPRTISSCNFASWSLVNMMDIRCIGTCCVVERYSIPCLFTQSLGPNVSRHDFIGILRRFSLFQSRARDSISHYVGPSVGQSVGRSVRRSVRPSVTLYFFFAKWLIELRVRDLWRSALVLI